jgi:hypothetical protein
LTLMMRQLMQTIIFGGMTNNKNKKE